MGKLYTLDGKLLTETPELRIGEKVYPVDSRQKTVKKILALADDESVPMGDCLLYTSPSPRDRG